MKLGQNLLPKIGGALKGYASAHTLPVTSGLVFWVRADKGVTSSTTFTWADQSGTGDTNKNLTATGTARPTFNAANSSYNNKPTIDYNGTTNYLQSGVWNTPLAQPFTEFVVGHTPSAATAILAAANLTATEADSRSLGGTPGIFAGFSQVSSNGGWSTPSAFGAVYNGANCDVFLNSYFSTVSGATNAGTNGRTGMILGDYAGALQGNNNWGHGGGGSIAEVITYNRILSASEIALVMQYLGTRYNITIAQLPVTSGLQLWLRADKGVTTGSTFTWADQSGTGDPNKNVSSTGTAMPTFNGLNTSYNNKPTVDFNGTTNHLLSGTWATALTQPFTAFLVGHTAGPNAANNLYALSSQAGFFGMLNLGGDTPGTFAGSGTPTVPTTWNTPGVLGAVFNGASSGLYFNNHNQNGNGVNPGTSGIPSLTVGDYASGANLQTNFQWGKFGTGSIAEVVMFNRVLTAAEITAMMNYLGNRYNIVIA